VQAPFITQLLNSAADLFGKVLKIPVNNNTIKASIPTCNIVNFTQTQMTTGWSNTDLQIQVSVINDSQSSLLAYALSCQLQTDTYRPNLGVIVFNLAYMPANLTSDYFDSLFKTTIHELTHVLGFSQSLYQYYINPATLLPYG
jgi:proprotein convertase subtilisin/kexin type 5